MDLSTNYKDLTVEKRSLKVQEFQRLRKSAGWAPVNDDAVKKALDNDLFSIAIMDGQEIVGMGRIIGDGGIYFYIQDIIVLKAYQGSGIGELIMNNIEEFISKTANQNSFIGLMAAAGVKAFYEKFGYKTRPDDGPGMFKVVSINSKNE